MGMRAIISSAVFALAALAITGCGPKLADCDALVENEGDCMNDASLAACQRENAICEERGVGEVFVLESCPLGFACGNSVVD